MPPATRGRTFKQAQTSALGVNIAVRASAFPVCDDVQRSRTLHSSRKAMTPSRAELQSALHPR